MSSAQAALEPTCLAALALPDCQEAALRAGRFLRRTQNQDGSWPAIHGDEESNWVTALAMVALSRSDSEAATRAADWLTRMSGREGHWFWRWKFRTADRRVRLDPDKYGWPWVPDTVSWVIPTSFSLIALQRYRTEQPELVHSRIQKAREMLIDRACPGGGWNAGNSVVFGVPLTAHLDTTAIALLGLQGVSHVAVTSGLERLRCLVPRCSSACSLAWACLAIAAHANAAGRIADVFPLLIQALQKPMTGINTETLAAAMLALRAPQEGNAFEVPT